MTLTRSYLSLGDRLSQVWLNRYTLIAVLIAIKLAIFFRNLSSELNRWKYGIVSHCDVIDQMYNNVMNNTPYYMGTAGNYLIEKAMVASVAASLETLSLLVKASEELISFVIDLYLGTYACLIVSAIDGTVNVATNTTEKLLGAVNTTIGIVANDLDDGLDDVSKFINKILSAASKVKDFLSGSNTEDASDSSVARVNLTVNTLRHLSISNSINAKLESLSANTPDFAELKNSTKNLIAIPFRSVRSEIKSKNASTIVGKAKPLQVPSKYPVDLAGSGICSQNVPEINQLFEDIIKCAKPTLLCFIILAVLFALFAMVPLAWNEYRLWDRLTLLKEQFAEKDGTVWVFDDDDKNSELSLYLGNDISTSVNRGKTGQDIIESYQRCFHPWNIRITDQIRKALRLILRKKTTNFGNQQGLEWILSYITSNRALTILGIGLAILVTSTGQLILVGLLHRKTNYLISQAQNGKLINANSSSSAYVDKQMHAWANDSNNYINTTEHNINTEIFGWLATTTESLNNTVVTVIDGIDDALAEIFNGTLLYGPMQTVARCAIENKLYALEHGLTWVRDTAQVNLPRIDTDDIQALLRQISSSQSGSAPDARSTLMNNAQSAIISTLRTYKSIAEREITIGAALVGIWAFQIPLAFAILALKRTRDSGTS